MLIKKKIQTIPEKIVDTFSKKHSGIWLNCMNGIQKSADDGHSWDKTKCVLPMELAVGASIDNKYTLKEYMKDEDMPDKVMMAFSWKKEKEIIVLPANVQSQASAIDLTVFGTKLLMLLTHPCAYVDMSAFDDIYDGFFYCIDHDRTAVDTEDREYRFNIITVKKGKFDKAGIFPIREGVDIDECIKIAYNAKIQPDDEQDIEDGWVEAVSEKDKKNMGDKDTFPIFFKYLMFINAHQSDMYVLDDSVIRLERSEEDSEMTSQPSARAWGFRQL